MVVWVMWMWVAVVRMGTVSEGTECPWVEALVCIFFVVWAALSTEERVLSSLTLHACNKIPEGC